MNIKSSTERISPSRSRNGKNEIDVTSLIYAPRETHELHDTREEFKECVKVILRQLREFGYYQTEEVPKSVMGGAIYYVAEKKGLTHGNPITLDGVGRRYDLTHGTIWYHKNQIDSCLNNSERPTDDELVISLD